MQNGPPAPWGICDADTKREETIEISNNINAYVAPLCLHQGFTIRAKPTPKQKPKTKTSKLYCYKEHGPPAHLPPPGCLYAAPQKTKRKNVKHKTQKRATVTVRKGKTPDIAQKKKKKKSSPSHPAPSPRTSPH